MKKCVQFKREQFTALRTIGIGSSSYVDLCFHNPTRRYCTIKTMNKRSILESNQTEHIQNERDILALISGHPNVVELLGTFQNEQFLYMVMEYVPGGEVFSHLRKLSCFEMDAVRFYSGEILLVLEELHKHNIIYRDLKPENLLFDRDGHIKFIDFGFAKKVDDRTYTICGTPEYLAPEIIRGEGCSFASDWWAFGVLIFEMLTGTTPFVHQNENEMYQMICRSEVEYPPDLDDCTKDLLTGLFQVDISKRLGCTSEGVKGIKDHPWFDGVDWDKMYKHKYQPPLMPIVNSDGDSSNFADYSNQIPEYDELTPEQVQKIKNENLFANF